MAVKQWNLKYVHFDEPLLHLTYPEIKDRISLFKTVLETVRTKVQVFKEDFPYLAKQIDRIKLLLTFFENNQIDIFKANLSGQEKLYLKNPVAAYSHVARSFLDSKYFVLDRTDKIQIKSNDAYAFGKQIEYLLYNIAI